MKLLDHNKLKDVFIDVLESKQVIPESINHLTSSLIQTSLRGVDSHGINLFPYYCKAVDSGRINNAPQIEIKKSSSSAIQINADCAFGHHAGSVGIQQAIKCAKEHGISAASVSNSTHFGAAAYFALQAANENCIGFSFTNADALVKAYNSTESFFGTNPICFTAPLKDEEPFCLDMATSLVSWNKIKNYRRDELDLEPGWAFDSEGKEVIKSKQAASLAPIGGYKGFDLGMMVDILCAMLSGSPNSKDLLPMFTSPIEIKREVSHFFMAIDVSKFISIDTFKSSLQNMVNRIRNLKKEGDEDVLVAGDPEKHYYKHRILEGIPIHDQVFSEFLSISSKFNEALK